MSVEAFERTFKERVHKAIRIKAAGTDRYRVLTPFSFDDGDRIKIILKREAGRWFLTDEAHTFMHISYSMEPNDLDTNNRQRIIQNALSMYSVSEDAGELRVQVDEGSSGDVLYRFVQAILRIYDVLLLRRDVVQSTFMEDLRTFLEEHTPAERRQFDWHDPVRDPEGNYAVDCHLNGMEQPLFIFGVSSDSKARDVTINLQQYELWRIPFRSLVIHEQQEELTRKVLARLSDVCEKQFSSLVTNKDRISEFLQTVLKEG